TFQLQNQSGTVVPATVTYSATTGVATLKSTASLASGTTYTATVRGGAAGARDLAGNPLAADIVWFFRTNGADTTAPAAGGVTRANGTTGVSTATAVTATFSEAMNASTLTGTTVTLAGPGGATVAASVAYSASTKTVTLTPGSALAAGTTYTATVLGGASGVK